MIIDKKIYIENVFYPFNAPTKCAWKKELVISEFISFFQQFVAIDNRDTTV